MGKVIVHLAFLGTILVMPVLAFVVNQANAAPYGSQPPGKPNTSSAGVYRSPPTLQTPRTAGTNPSAHIAPGKAGVPARPAIIPRARITPTGVTPSAAIPAGPRIVPSSVHGQGRGYAPVYQQPRTTPSPPARLPNTSYSGLSAPSGKPVTPPPSSAVTGRTVTTPSVSPAIPKPPAGTAVSAPPPAGRGPAASGPAAAKRYGDALVAGMYDPKGTSGTPSRGTPSTATRGAGSTLSHTVAGAAGHRPAPSGSHGSTPAIRQAGTPGHPPGSGTGHPQHRSEQYHSAGYAGDDGHLRPVRIHGLHMESRGTPIHTYLIPADPRTGRQPALAWWGGATILIDGAQHVIDLNNERRGLDTWKSANIQVVDGKPDYTISNYQRLDKNGLPDLSIVVARDPNDPTKWIPVRGPDGHPISRTALQYRGQYVDSSRIPGIAINQQMQKHNLRLGDPVYVHNTANGRGAWGIVMDLKGKNRKENTEVNVNMANRLGINSDPRRGGTSSPTLVYTAYPGAGRGKNTKPEDWQPDAIRNAGQSAAWDNGFDPSKTQWHLPQPQQPAQPAARSATPRTRSAPVTPRQQPGTSSDEAPLPDSHYMSK